MATNSGHSERVLVVLEGPACELALETAARVAARHGARLVGLFVEDADLLTTAGLPFAREIGLASGASRPLSRAGIEAQLHERAARLRAVLDRLARSNRIEAELEIGRGRQTQAVLARLRPSDLLVLCRTHSAQRAGGMIEGVIAEAVCTVMLVGPEGAPAPHGPMVLLDDTGASDRALAWAITVVRGEARPVTLALAPAVAPDAQARARALLAEAGIEASSLTLLHLDASAVLQAVRRERPSILFVGRDSPLFSSAEGRRLRAELDEVPLVVVP